MLDLGLDTPVAIEGILLGFDFGLKRIGTAVGQTLTMTATPLKTLQASEGAPTWSEVDAIIQQWNPNALVVGIPLNMDGTEQPLTKLARQFGLHLKNRYRLPVYGADERLTSCAARQSLFDAGGYKLLKKKPIDSYAAQIILESWMAESAKKAE